jgi:hypothetical protein
MTSQSRRDLLKKTLAVGAAAYVAPKLVGQVTTVHAQQLSGTVCPQIEPDCATFSCFQGECACVPTVGGPTVCVIPSCLSACATTADCPAGSVCFTTLDCCGAGTWCVPLCFAPAGSSGAHKDPWKHR